MKPSELDALARRANQAGHPSIAHHYAALITALTRISDTNSGPYGRIAYNALHGRGDYSPTNQPTHTHQLP